MKRCLNPICRMLNTDSAEVCKSCKSRNFVHVEDQLPNVSESSLGLLGTQEAQAPTGTDDETVKQVVEQQNESAINAPPENRSPSEVTSDSHPKTAVFHLLRWAKRQIRQHLMASIAIAGLLLTLVGLPQVIYLWNRVTNHQPVIKIVSASASVIQLGEEVSLTAVADDADDRALNYQWGHSAGTILGNGPNVTLSTAGVNRGSAPIAIDVVLTVVDSQLAESSPYLVTIRISNSKPRLKAIELDKMELRVGEPVKLIAVADDPGGDRAGKLHYDWNCPVGQIDRSDFYKTTLQTSGLSLRSAPIFPKVRVTVSNDRGESTEGEITLSITPAVRRVYRAKRTPAKETTTFIVDVVKPLALRSRTTEEAAPPPQASPQQQAPANPPEVRSPEIVKPSRKDSP